MFAKGMGSTLELEFREGVVFALLYEKHTSSNMDGVYRRHTEFFLLQMMHATLATYYMLPETMVLRRLSTHPDVSRKKVMRKGMS